MSDDLVKRARHNALADMPHYASVELIEALADRIEELEAELAEYKHVASAIDKQWAESQDEIADLKAKLAKAVTRLQHIAANKTTDELTVIEWDTYDMFTILNACISEARTTLAELTSSEAAYGEAKGDNDE